MERAKALRRGQTDAEARLWSRLRASQLGAKFSRQHPIHGYIADFCCIEQRLIVELDGGQHLEKRGYDLRRNEALEALGFRVLRFWNDDVLLRTDDVANAILLALNQSPPPHPNPLPRYSRGRGGKSGGARITPGARGETPSPPSGSSLGGRAGVRGRSPEEAARQEKSGGPFSRREALRLRARLNALENPLPQTAPSLGGEGWVRGRGSRGQGASGDSSRSSTCRSSKVREVFLLRARLNALIRDFFAQRGVLEAETPILSAAGNTDLHIEGFATQFSGSVQAGARERFLRTSPEYPLKRLLAAGVGDCYELGRVFRNGEAGRSHNPEFTLLEWYRVGWDHHRLMDECAELVRAALGLVGRPVETNKTSYINWFRSEFDLDPSNATDAELRAPLAEFGIEPDGLTRDDWLDLLITHRLQPALPRDAVTLVYDYPASQCALAKLRQVEDGPSVAKSSVVAERFELYLGPYELANGYHELNDAAEQRVSSATTRAAANAACASCRWTKTCWPCWTPCPIAQVSRWAWTAC